MHHSKQFRLRQQIKFLRSQFLQGSVLPLSDVLSQSVIMQALAVTGIALRRRRSS